MRKKNETDRTTRMLVTITLLGGTWYIFRGVIDIWFRTFTEIIYTKSIINYEHILSIWILVIMVVITGTVIRYLYLEFKNYQHIPNNDDRLNSISKADKGFKDIINIVKFLINVSKFFIIMFLLFNVFIRIKWKILVGVGLLWGLLYMLTFKKKSRNQKTRINVILKNKFFIFKNQIGLIIYLIVFVGIVSFSMIVFSFEGNQEVNMKINNTNKMPMEILLNNYDKPTVEISISRNEKPNSNVIVKLEEDDFQKSLVEVFESRVSKENFFLKSIEGRNSKTAVSKNKYSYKYHLDLEKYILEKENIIEVYIHNNGSMNKKTVHLVTSIYKEGNKVNVSQDKFKVSP